MDPYAAVSADLSNNNLGGEGSKELISYIKDVVSSGIQGFKTLNLSNNGFNKEIIDDIQEFIKKRNYEGKIII